MVTDNIPPNRTKVALVCTMSRPNQQWSTSALQPIQVTFLHTDGATAISAPLGRSAR